MERMKNMQKDLILKYLIISAKQLTRKAFRSLGQDTSYTCDALIQLLCFRSVFGLESETAFMGKGGVLALLVMDFFIETSLSLSLVAGTPL